MYAFLIFWMVRVGERLAGRKEVRGVEGGEGDGGVGGSGMMGRGGRGGKVSRPKSRLRRFPCPTRIPELILFIRRFRV